MSQKEKLEKRLLSRPKDFVFEELETLFRYYGLYEQKHGKTGGSRVKFSNEDGSIIMSIHKPHNPDTFKMYMIDQIIGKLREEGLL